MRKIISVLIVIPILFAFGCGSCSDNNKDMEEELSGKISISGAFALYPLAQKWAEEFQKIHPKVKIDISLGIPGKGISDVLSGNINIGMVSDKISKEDIEKGIWFVAVYKDAVIPIINDNNPVLQKLNKDGFSQKVLSDIFISGKITSWGQATNDKKVEDKINIFTRADACDAADIWAKYLNKKQEDLLGKTVFGDSGITKGIKNDKNGIGFNNIASVYSKSKYVNSGIRVLPIDFNNNGIIDDNEYFYQHRDSIINAVADGRYPSSLTRELFLICKGKPEEKNVLAFLNWILTSGQKYITEFGYINLSKTSINNGLEKLK